MLKRIALTAAILYSNAYAVSIDGVNILRAFDGRAASCKTQDDYARTMRTGAYIVSNLTVVTNSENQLLMNMNVTTFHCIKKDDTFQFERRSPTDPITFEWIRFANGQSERINITVEKKDVELIAVSDDYVLLDTSAIVPSRRGYSTDLKINILDAMNADLIQNLENGETVKLRIGLMKRSKVRYISPDSISNFQQTSGGTFYVFINIRKDQDKISVEIE